VWFIPESTAEDPPFMVRLMSIVFISGRCHTAFSVVTEGVSILFMLCSMEFSSWGIFTACFYASGVWFIPVSTADDPPFIVRLMSIVVITGLCQTDFRFDAMVNSGSLFYNFTKRISKFNL
jgi:hypothetical protein